MKVIDDAFQLVSEVIRKSSIGDEFVECNIVLEKSDAIAEEDFIYNCPETPYFLTEHKLMEVISASGVYPRGLSSYLDLEEGIYVGPGGTILPPHNLKGLMAVRFNVVKAKEWYESELSKRIHSEQIEVAEVWYPKFICSGNTLKLPPFGKCKFSMKNHPQGEHTNQRLVLVEAVVIAGEDGISAGELKGKFEEKGITPPDNRRIDAMIVPLNKRFEKCFEGARVNLVNAGDKVPDGVKKIRLSVIPTSKK